MSCSSRSGDRSPIDQTVAVNAHGWAITDPLSDTRQPYTVINCHKPIYAGVESALSDTTKKTIQRQTLNFTDTELDIDSTSELRKFLVIGYAYPDREKAKTFTKVADGPKSRRPVGTVKNPGKLVDLPNGKIPWLVVINLIARMADNSKQFVLFHPEDGLCCPFQSALMHTFYFHEFRNKATSVRKRSDEWMRLARQQSIKPILLGELYERGATPKSSVSTEEMSVDQNSTSPTEDLASIDMKMELDADEIVIAHQNGGQSEPMSKPRTGKDFQPPGDLAANTSSVTSSTDHTTDNGPDFFMIGERTVKAAKPAVALNFSGKTEQVENDRFADPSRYSPFR